MADVLRILGSERAINATANTIDGNSFVRIVSKDTAAATITHQKSTGNVTITIPAGGTIYINKAPGEAIFSSNITGGVLAAPVKLF